ncbi:MAG: L-proline cis-4-hydroxylase [Mucilaginibacter sp.]|nr:L-proline cis-4-hydroxylase [Mucilaginibacter sp.]MDB5140802.1 L-proline cis-4-hydroxylase [Mucilaginibacter sp.]
MIRYAKLPLGFNLADMQNELLSINDGWQEHFNTYYYEGAWTVLALRSPGGNSKNIIPDLIRNSVYMDTALMEYFPSVKKLLSTLSCPVMSVRFLNLKAGAVIKPHRDNELAFEKGEARLHFPVITNPGVKFYIENELVPLKEGNCWYINANLPHSVLNEGTTDRMHLVIDCKVNDWLKGIVALADEISLKEETPDSDLLLIINELRLHHTEASDNIANELEKQLKEK